MAKPEKRKTTEDPISRPTRVLGVTICRSNIDWTKAVGCVLSDPESMMACTWVCHAEV